jgi:putative MATE family efflux protein
MTSIAAFFVNVFFNWVFIFGKLGAPRMEIAGAALGTLIARIFELFVICGYFFFLDKRIGYRIRNVVMRCGDLLKEYIRISIPVLISDGILALGNNSVAMIVGRLGEQFIAANAVTTVTQQLSSVMIQGFSQAGAIVTGYTLGEGDRDKAFRQGYAFLGLGIAFGLIAAGILTAISGWMISAYDLSAETQAIARQLMWSIAIIIVFQATNSIMTKGVLRGGGDTRFCLLAEMLCLWGVAIPAALLGSYFHLPVPIVLCLMKVDEVLKCVICIFRLKLGNWMRALTRERTNTDKTNA